MPLIHLGKEYLGHIYLLKLPKFSNKFDTSPIGQVINSMTQSLRLDVFVVCLPLYWRVLRDTYWAFSLWHFHFSCGWDHSLEICLQYRGWSLCSNVAHLRECLTHAKFAFKLLHRRASLSPIPPPPSLPTFLWSRGRLLLLLRFGRERHIHFQHLFLRDMIQRAAGQRGSFVVIQRLRSQRAHQH